MTDEDLPFLMEVYASTRAEEMRLTGWNEIRIAEFISMQFNAQHKHYTQYYPNAKMDVIYVDGEPAGRLYVEHTTKEIRIMDICLLPEFKGKGIGYHYMQQLMDEGKEKCLPVSLHVEKNNPSKSFYDRLGFKVLEDREVYWFMEWKL
ncbi:GNAT family N-acetyltransferase [bacterium]|nr:GNAT family N-acetyltransferase [bacterium]